MMASLKFLDLLVMARDVNRQVDESLDIVRQVRRRFAGLMEPTLDFFAVGILFADVRAKEDRPDCHDEREREIGGGIGGHSTNHVSMCNRKPTTRQTKTAFAFHGVWVSPHTLHVVSMHIWITRHAFHIPIPVHSPRLARCTE